MSTVVDYIEQNKSEFSDYEYLQQYAPEAEGLQFNDEIPFTRMQQLYEGDTVWGGISGERHIREYMATDLLNGNFTRDRLKQGLTRAELNDLINYFSWNTYDLLALRATEGESEIIPRQEYEFLSTTYAIQRWPEYFKLLIHNIGFEGIMDAGLKSRQELGGLLNNGSGWCYFVVPGFGAIGLEGRDLVDADDPIHMQKKRVCYSVGATLASATRGEDGYLLPSQDRYVSQTKNDDVIEFVSDHLFELEATEMATIRQLLAASELFSFLLHYDNRVGQADHGPYFVENGKPMIIRELGLNRPYLPWNDMAENRDLPITVTIALVINPKELGLQEIRVPISTMTHPADHLSAVEKAAVFIRHENETIDPLPLEELEIPTMDDISDLTARTNEAIQEWYERATRQSRREKIMNGAMTYSIGMIMPLLRATGVFDYVHDDLDLFELPPMTSEFYYRMHGGVAKEQMPMQIMFGHGWSEIPEEPAQESGYADYLADAREMNWHSDLSGMQEFPNHWADHADENNLLDIDLTFEGDMSRHEFADLIQTL